MNVYSRQNQPSFGATLHMDEALQKTADRTLSRTICNLTTITTSTNSKIPKLSSRLPQLQEEFEQATPTSHHSLHLEDINKKNMLGVFVKKQDGTIIKMDAAGKPISVSVFDLMGDKAKEYLVSAYNRLVSAPVEFRALRQNMYVKMKPRKAATGDTL